MKGGGRRLWPISSLNSFYFFPFLSRFLAFTFIVGVRQPKNEVASIWQYHRISPRFYAVKWHFKFFLHLLLVFCENLEHYFIIILLMFFLCLLEPVLNKHCGLLPKPSFFFFLPGRKDRPLRKQGSNGKMRTDRNIKKSKKSKKKNHNILTLFFKKKNGQKLQKLRHKLAWKHWETKGTLLIHLVHAVLWM